MPGYTILPILARFGFAGFFLLTSLYCLLAYVPFTYQQIHKGGLLPALNVFAQWHARLYWLALWGMVASHWFAHRPGQRRERITRALRWGFWSISCAAGVLLQVRPVLPNLENASSSFGWSLGALVPILWLALIDWCELETRILWRPAPAQEDRRLFRAAWQSALFLALLYAAIAAARGFDGPWQSPAPWFALAVSALGHLLAFLAVISVIALLNVVASWLPRSTRYEFLFAHIGFAFAVWAVFRAIIFPSISFNGELADGYAAAFALAASATLLGAALWRAPEVRIGNGFSLALWLRPEQTPARPGLALAAVAMLAAAAVWLAFSSARLDWNYLVQKLAALAVWGTAFRLFYSWALRLPRLHGRSFRPLLVALVALICWRTLEATQRQLWKQFHQPQSAAEFLERYAGYDVSFKLVRQVFVAARADSGFYRFLTQNTNIRRSVHIEPVPVRHVEELTPNLGPKPNIFVFVIDSLRRDYLSPYRSDIEFTPEIGKFAAESVVFENAFTRYGGTGLAEPSIWVGGMMIHQQYVTPFAPMNSLQRLLEADQYRAFITRDTILQTVVSPWPRMAEIDENKGTMNLDFCESLDELQGKLAAQPAEPFFAYTQPQNLHISVINRQGGKPIDDANYRGFHAPYASRVRRLDGCFGKFAQFLKERGLYDNSIIVLTADHGDSLGEGGRWGHAYTIYPEVLRVPLIVHVPARLRETHAVNPRLVAFSTDITPSLYYLLGHRPTVRHELLGRPLFTERPEEQGPYRRDQYLVASSYGAVYGVLSGDGRSLYISDGVNYRDYAFNLAGATPSTESISTSRKAENEKWIRERILALGQFYGCNPPAQPAQLASVIPAR